jgi:hypothetical protein
MASARSDWETAEPRSGLSQVGRPGATPLLRCRSLRTGRIRVAGARRNYAFGGPSEGNGGAHHSISQFLTSGPPVPSSQNSCQVALVTLEVTAEVDASGHAHIGVP